MSSRACIRMIEAACVSTISTVRSLGLEFVCIRDLLSPLLFIICAGSSVTPALYWCAVGASVCRRPYSNGRLTGRMHYKVEGMKRRY